LVARLEVFVEQAKVHVAVLELELGSVDVCFGERRAHVVKNGSEELATVELAEQHLPVDGRLSVWVDALEEQHERLDGLDVLAERLAAIRLLVLVGEEREVTSGFVHALASVEKRQLLPQLLIAYIVLAEGFGHKT